MQIGPTISGYISKAREHPAKIFKDYQHFGTKWDGSSKGKKTCLYGGFRPELRGKYFFVILIYDYLEALYDAINVFLESSV